MPRRAPPTIALVSVPGTLSEVDPLLRRAGVLLVRLASVRIQAVEPSEWLHRLLRTPRPDTVVITSRAAVNSGVRPWFRGSKPDLAALDFWAVGPETARALREAGIRRVHRPRSVGALGIARALGRAAPRNIVCFRSNAAGPRLARSLRSLGHRVSDVVVYRLESGPRFSERSRRALVSADLIVISSPSGLSEVRHRLDRTTFGKIAKTRRIVVLGERSLRSARGHGFRQVSVVPPTTAQRFTRHLLRELEHARA